MDGEEYIWKGERNIVVTLREIQFSLLASCDCQVQMDPSLITLNPSPSSHSSLVGQSTDQLVHRKSDLLCYYFWKQILHIVGKTLTFA